MLTPKVSIFVLCAASGCFGQTPVPTFGRDILPLLQTHCQECHRPGEVAPMPLMTYAQARPWARAIRSSVLSGKMPPWFADPCCGKFANDRSLSASERDTIARWVDAGSKQGDPKQAPPPRVWAEGWNLPSQPDAVFAMPHAFTLPAKESVDYQYFIVPTGFTEDRWVTAVECKPSNAGVVHHAVIYLREPGQTWTRGPTKADILTVYTPGATADVLPDGMAKLVKAGSDLVFEIHYTPNGKPATDLTRVGLIFAKTPPRKRVLTLQMTSTSFQIPPGDANHRVSVSGTLPNDALILSFLPHMHLRGKSFEYTMKGDDGHPITLLKVPHYDFYWQLSYKLAQPLLVKKGTRLEWIAYFDNSANNPRNPDPTVGVSYGLQSTEEMMVGFFDVAVDPGVDKKAFFIR